MQDARISKMREQGAIVSVVYGKAGLDELLTDIIFYKAAYEGTLAYPINAKDTYSRRDHHKREARRHWPGGILR